jgi:hypothetical protein
MEDSPAPTSEPSPKREAPSRALMWDRRPLHRSDTACRSGRSRIHRRQSSTVAPNLVALGLEHCSALSWSSASRNSGCLPYYLTSYLNGYFTRARRYYLAAFEVADFASRSDPLTERRTLTSRCARPRNNESSLEAVHR